MKKIAILLSSVVKNMDLARKLEELTKTLLECGAKLMESMRIMFVHLGENIFSREIINNYSKEYNPKIGKSVIKELIKYS